MKLFARLRSDDRGAAAVIVAVAMTLLLVAAAFAVDLGMQRVLRRDLQAMTDIVALDMARHLDGRSHAEIKGSNEWRSQFEQSVERNLNVSPAPEVKVKQQQEEAVATIVETPGLVLTAVLGEFDPTTDKFKTIPYQEVPTAVKVTATSSVDFAFSGVVDISKGGATRSAVAQPAASACFGIGTIALGLASNKSALNGLLGDALNIGVLGYDGLATSSVSLLGIATDLGVGTPEALLEAQNLTIGRLIDAAATVLGNQSPVAKANLELLKTIKTRLDAAGMSGRLVKLGELIDLGTGRDSGLDAEINLLDLVSGAAFVANGTNAISVPGLNLAVPGLANLTASLNVIEAPRIACGNGVARTGQFDLTLEGDLAVGVCPSGLLSILKVCVGGPIKIKLALAEAEGQLAAVRCTGTEVDSVDIKVTKQSLASTTIGLGDPDPLALKAGVLWFGLVDLDLLGLKVAIEQNDFASTYTLDPWEDFVDVPFRTPQTPVSVPPISEASLELAGLNLDWLLQPVAGLLNPVITGVNNLVAGVLAPALGLRIAGVDLWVLDDPQPSCGGPVRQLVG